MAGQDYFSEFGIDELRVHLKALQRGLLNPTRQVLFKDQQLTFSTAQEIKDRINLVQQSIDIKNGGTGKRTKRVLIQTVNKGFE